MSLIDGLRHRLYVLVRREAYARDVERELRFHVDLDVLARASDTPNALDAEGAARRRLGNATYYREEVRRMTLLSWLDRVRQDLLYALRGLRRSPGFATTVIVTLALGFGVNAAMYEMLDAVFRRPPAGVVDPGGVRRVFEDLSRPKEPGGRLMFGGFTYPHFRAVATAAEPVPLAGFTTPDSVNLGDGDRRLATRASKVTGEYFRILGLRPELGRFFTGEEDSIAVQTPVAVISDGLWRSAFNADSSILGRSIRVDRKPITVVGVAPPDFTGIDLNAVGLWLPANMIEPSSGYLGNGAPIPWYESFGGSMQLLTRIQTPSDEVRLVTTGTVQYAASTFPISSTTRHHTSFSDRSSRRVVQ